MTTIAKETIEFRSLLGTALGQALPAAAACRVNLGAVLAAARPALDAGWPGAELARHALLGVAVGDNPGALLVAHLRDLAEIAPPPVSGPTTGQRVLVTAPTPLPECANCATPFGRGDRTPPTCPGCGAPLQLVEFDHNPRGAAA
jgi:hypothetical protein